MVFVGRVQEQEILKNIFKSNKEELFILYGRRRLGKTTLLKKVLPKDNSFYFLCTQESLEQNMIRFVSQLSRHLNRKSLSSIRASSWEELFEILVDELPEKFIFVFDEFPYLSNQDKSVLSQFQKIYDEYIKSKNMKIVLSGSSISIMLDIQSYSSPLYGRRTGSLKLEPFNIKETKDLLESNLSLYDVFRYHMVFGGVPYYLQFIDSNLDFNENIKKLFFTTASIFQDEAVFLLKEEVRELKNYLTILRVIASGVTMFSKIADVSGIDRGSLSKYLTNLELLSLIKVVRSFFDKSKSKNTRYKIEDPFLQVYFSIIEKYKGQLDNKNIQESILQQELPSVLGYIFEQEVIKILKKEFEQIGNYFNKSGVEIDIVGKNGNKLTCFECKFRKNMNKELIIKKLDEKIKHLPNEYEYSTELISIDKGITLDDVYNRI